MAISEEVRIELDKIQEEFNKKTAHVLRQHAIESDPYTLGDIIEDHYQIGRYRFINTKIKELVCVD